MHQLRNALVGAALVLALWPSPAWARPPEGDDDAILGDEEAGWSVEDLQLRASYFLQRGRGFQSTAGSTRGPGSEDAWVLEPQIAVGLRQSQAVRHDVYLALDVVTAASPDAVDLITEASRVTEAGDVDVTTRFATASGEIAARYGIHIEEHFQSFHAGAGFVGSMLEDNTRPSISFNLALDSFDPLTIRGRDVGTATRGTANINAGLGQVLSETTLLDVGYGVTYQAGVLETTWSSVPAEKPPGASRRFSYTRISEQLPDARFRHAIHARLAQHVPLTRSTLKGAYRFYVDQFGMLAHTAELMLYQYVTPWLLARASYRLHDQSGVDFYMELAPGTLDQTNAKRTADSDMAPFAAREVGLMVAIHRPRAPVAFRDDDELALSYFQYWRTNNLRVHMLSLGYSRRFR